MQINASVVLIECSDRNIAPHPKIVAIGSSTTAGEGNIRACPGRLLCFLRDEYPNAAITLANKGIGGQEAPVELQRFDTDVIAEKSDLVIWQIGTTRAIRDGLVRLRAASTRRGHRQPRTSARASCSCIAAGSDRYRLCGADFRSSPINRHSRYLTACRKRAKFRHVSLCHFSPVMLKISRT